MIGFIFNFYIKYNLPVIDFNVFGNNDNTLVIQPIVFLAIDIRIEPPGYHDLTAAGPACKDQKIKNYTSFHGSGL